MAFAWDAVVKKFPALGDEHIQPPADGMQPKIMGHLQSSSLWRAAAASDVSFEFAIVVLDDVEHRDVAVRDVRPWDFSGASDPENVSLVGYGATSGVLRSDSLSVGGRGLRFNDHPEEMIVNGVTYHRVIQLATQTVTSGDSGTCLWAHEDHVEGRWPAAVIFGANACETYAFSVEAMCRELGLQPLEVVE